MSLFREVQQQKAPRLRFVKCHSCANCVHLSGWLEGRGFDYECNKHKIFFDHEKSDDPESVICDDHSEGNPGPEC